jgi:chemotaxis protein methyltransferase WspC
VYLEPDHYEALCHLALLAEQAGDAPQAATLRRRAGRIFERRPEAGAAR